MTIRAATSKAKSLVRTAGHILGPAQVIPNAVVETYQLKDDGTYPNSKLPVLHYRGVLDLPAILPALFVRRMFAANGWTNSWTAGIYTFDHYHSNTHEALAIIKGSTKLRLGGRDGITVAVRKGDVLILPAGTAHRNLQDENAVVCVGAYPLGKKYDIMRGQEEERKTALANIKVAPFPSKDPVYGLHHGTSHLWPSLRLRMSVAGRSGVNARRQADPKKSRR